METVTGRAGPGRTGCVIANEHWRLGVAEAQAVVTDLGFTARGRDAQPCANLLKTLPIDGPFAVCFQNCSPPSPRPLTALVGGQTGYTAATGASYTSAAAMAATVTRAAPHCIVVENIRYGNVRESWTITLAGRRLCWLVEQEWLATTELVDAFLPALLFSASPNWGEGTVFQLWSRAMAQDDFYGHTAILDAAMPISRRTARAAGGSMIAKLLSHAVPDADLRVTADGHIKKAELTNFCSYLGQSAFCEPEGRLVLQPGQLLRLGFTLEPAPEPTGLQLDVGLRGPLAATAVHNRRFYDVYMNAGIMADTQRWRFGNSPSGYVALFCQYMYSELARFGVPAGPLCAEEWDGHQVLRQMITEQSAHLQRDGSVGNCYLPQALDTLPAYLLAARDLLCLTGDRALAAEVYPAARIAFEAVARTLDAGAGLIVATGDRCTDYWDWIARDGVVTSINVLTYAGLHAFAETARWLGDADRAAAAQAGADTLARQFQAQLWDEERGFYADWRDRQGRRHFYLYAGPQLLGIVAGLIPPDRARRVVAAVRARRRELGPDWENCFSLQTNFFDAQKQSAVYGGESNASSYFGQAMNGGCLASWNYYWIGALAKVGLVDEAIDAWRRVVDRFAQTSLIEGSNYWDYAGQPSRTKPVDDPQIAYEPCLADQGLVAVAPLRWLLGINPRLDGLAVQPVLPAEACPAAVRVRHLGRIETVRF